MQNDLSFLKKISNDMISHHDLSPLLLMVTYCRGQKCQHCSLSAGCCGLSPTNFCQKLQEHFYEIIIFFFLMSAKVHVGNIATMPYSLLQFKQERSFDYSSSSTIRLPVTQLTNLKINILLTFYVLYIFLYIYITLSIIIYWLMPN